MVSRNILDIIPTILLLENILCMLPWTSIFKILGVYKKTALDKSKAHFKGKQQKDPSVDLPHLPTRDMT